jgi:NADH-quinone oxidoreductase subunit G
LIDAGSLSDGEENLAGTAKPLRAVVSIGTAASLGVLDGDAVRVSTASGAVVAPVVIDHTAVDGIIWLPTNHRDGSVRATLGAVYGDSVMVTAGGTAGGTA